VLFDLVFVETIFATGIGVVRESLGKYWQLNQNNEHVENNRLYNTNTLRRPIIIKYDRYNKQAQKNLGEQTEIHIPGTYVPQRNFSTVHYHYAHRSSAPPGGPLGVFHPCLRPLKAPGSTLGKGRQASRHPPWSQYPFKFRNLNTFVS